MSWNALGTITPTTLGIWHSFGPLALHGDRPTVRITFPTVGPADRFLSWLWFRLQLTYNGEISYTPLFRIYPTADPELRELSIPAPFRNLDGAIWRPQIQKRIKFRGLAGTTTEPPWAVAISQWSAAPVVPAFNPLRVDWRLEDLFDDYYLADVTVYNAGPEPIYEWAITFNSGDITETWGAELEAVGANAWGLAPSVATGDPAIMPGETRTFTIRGEGTTPNLTNLTAIVL